MANGNGDKKRKASVLDEQFEFPPIPNWRQGQKQKQLGSDLIRHEPKEPIAAQPLQVDFEFKDHDEIWAFGPNTRFHVSGIFESRAENATAWTPCGVADDELKKVVVAPNFLEMMIKSVDFFHGNVKINSSDEGRCVAPFLNAWKYNYMSEDQKKMLLPQDVNPGFGVPSKKGDAGWSMAANSEWVTNYGPKIFTGKNIMFDYIPLDLPPFFQGSNYMEEPQKILPMPNIEKLTLRVVFNDHLDYIFKIKNGNAKKYRFAFKEFYLVAEHMKLSKGFQASILNKRSQLAYPGVARIMRTENIPASNTNHKAKIQSVPLPEGIFIFALHKNVLSGTYNYGDNTDGNVFMPHNIKEMNLMYGEKQFFLNSPHIGMITDDTIELKLYYDYLTAPPFGMKMDPKKILIPLIKNGCKETAYPHVFMNLCNYGDKTRIVPFLDDGSILNKNHDLDLTFTFEDEGAPANTTFIIYLYYTDHNLTLETKKKGESFFTSPYIRLI